MQALFLQCTDASYYPPILNASKLMADAGWRVTVLSSLGGDGTGLAAGAHPGVEHLGTPPRRGNAVRPLEYALYCSASVAQALRLRPRIIYASDPLSALPALLSARVSGAFIVYHEHDSPGPGVLRPSLARWRAAAARRARLVITPNCARGHLLREELGLAADRLRTVWNLPRRAELPTLPRGPREPLVLYYHGSITPDRLPRAVVEAVRRLGGRIRLRIGGYEAPGARGYVGELMQLGGSVGGAPLVETAGLVPERPDLLARAAQADVGLALMPLRSDDINMRHMTGASNKPFDYMAAGLALLVSDLDDWRRMFVDAGFGRACNPADPDSIAAALRWFLEHERESRAMALRGRSKIEADWNYDTAFAPILGQLAGD